MPENTFTVTKADYHGDLSRVALIATLSDPKQVSTCFMRAAKIQKKENKVQTYWPQISLQRRRELFTWMKLAKDRTGNQYQLRLGSDDVQMHMKEPGGYYYPLPLELFCRDAGKSLEDLPGLYKGREVAVGRTRGKRTNGSPQHQERNAAKKGKAGEESSSGEDSEEEEQPPVQDLPDITISSEDQKSETVTNSFLESEGERKETPATKEEVPKKCT